MDLGICIFGPFPGILKARFRLQDCNRSAIVGSRRAPNRPAPTLFSLTLQAWRNHGDLRGNGQAARHSFCGKLEGEAGLRQGAQTPQLSKRRQGPCPWGRNVYLKWYLSSCPQSPSMSFLCPQSMLIFKDLKLRGFWLSQWKKDHSRGEWVMAPLPRVLQEVSA